MDVPEESQTTAESTSSLETAVFGSPGPEPADLVSSIAALSNLATGRRPLVDILVEVAHLAVKAIPGADGAGLTLTENDRSDTIVATAAFVRDIDAIQYDLREGPCISAAAERRTMRSGSLGGEQRWPRFGPRVGRLGVHSVLSLPLLASDESFGAMNVYAHRQDAFNDDAARLGELFAKPAAIAVQNAQILQQAKRLAAGLQAAAVSRAVIDQALGIIRSRTGCSSDEAYARLRTMSQTKNTKLAVIAETLVNEAVRRAIARHTAN
ncbi:MAG: GAF and ANTAR domain-containing protein [Nakamurella sp.]